VCDESVDQDWVHREYPDLRPELGDSDSESETKEASVYPMTCPICREDDISKASLQANEAAFLPCAHVFHVDCIKTSVKFQLSRGHPPSCALCNTGIDDRNVRLLGGEVNHVNLVSSSSSDEDQEWSGEDEAEMDEEQKERAAWGRRLRLEESTEPFQFQPVSMTWDAFRTRRTEWNARKAATRYAQTRSRRATRRRDAAAGRAMASRTQRHRVRRQHFLSGRSGGGSGLDPDIMLSRDILTEEHLDTVRGLFGGLRRRAVWPVDSGLFRDQFIEVVQAQFGVSTPSARQSIVAAGTSRREWGFGPVLSDLAATFVYSYVPGFEALALHRTDHTTLVEGNMVTCQIMMAAWQLLREVSRPAGGSILEEMQDTQLILDHNLHGRSGFRPVGGVAIAFLHVNGNHWVLVENVDNVVRFWDTVRNARRPRVRHAIHQLFGRKHGRPRLTRRKQGGSARLVPPSMEVPVLCVDVHSQRGGVECGPRCVAFAREVIAGTPVDDIRAMQWREENRSLHEWLLFGFEDGFLSPFPHRVRPRRGPPGREITVLPEKKPCKPRGRSPAPGKLTMTKTKSAGRRSTRIKGKLSTTAWDAEFGSK
jgi:hypothetical protein